MQQPLSSHPLTAYCSRYNALPSLLGLLSKVTPALAAVNSNSSSSSSDTDSISVTRNSGSGPANSSRETSSSTGSGKTGSSRRVPQLPPPCDLGGAEPQARWNAVSLAFLGDAVWEAHLRSHLYRAGSQQEQQNYNRRVAAKANTHAQATCYQLLLSEGWPSSDEASLMRWAANSSSVAPPKHATRQQYKQATALEALVAYLYLKDGQRLQELMEWLLADERVQLWRADMMTADGNKRQPQKVQQQDQQQQQSGKQPGGGQRRRRRGETAGA